MGQGNNFSAPLHVWLRASYTPRMMLGRVFLIGCSIKLSLCQNWLRPKALWKPWILWLTTCCCNIHCNEESCRHFLITVFGYSSNFATLLSFWNFWMILKDFSFYFLPTCSFALSKTICLSFFQINYFKNLLSCQSVC